MEFKRFNLIIDSPKCLLWSLTQVLIKQISICCLVGMLLTHLLLLTIFISWHNAVTQNTTISDQKKLITAKYPADNYMFKS